MSNIVISNISISNYFKTEFCFIYSVKCLSWISGRAGTDPLVQAGLGRQVVKLNILLMRKNKQLMWQRTLQDRNTGDTPDCAPTLSRTHTRHLHKTHRWYRSGQSTVRDTGECRCRGDHQRAPSLQCHAFNTVLHFLNTSVAFLLISRLNETKLDI